MKIKYITGDVFQGNEPIILHGCNSKGRMGSGIAKSIRNTYPKAYEEYRHQFLINGLDLGSVIYVQVNPIRCIANGITQEFYGRTGEVFVDYDAINRVVANVNTYAIENNINSIAMPLIGAGLGGGSWEIISGIIENQITDSQPIVYTLDGIIPTS